MGDPSITVEVLDELSLPITAKYFYGRLHDPAVSFNAPLYAYVAAV